MGKVVEMNNPKRKRGRPPKNPPSNPINYDSIPTCNRRSARRNPSYLNSPSEYDEEEDDDDDDERKEKKSKFVGQLPRSNEKTKTNQRHSEDFDSGSGSGSESESEDQDMYAKKRKINTVDGGSDDVVSGEEKKVVKVTQTPLHVSLMESGPATPLPDKKLLVFILDRIQKKDTYGVFSEAVDPDELPDYFEIIEQPMDFGTVRKKLESGAYRNLEELEADIYLICSNAMQYNSPSTVYYRQARSIEELAKRDFANLKQEGDDGELQPKVVRRGRPPGRPPKKPIETSPIHSVTPEPSSGANPSTGEDRATGSNSYNLRKAPTVSRFRSPDTFVSSYRPRNGENYSEWSVDWNNEFPASVLRADIKHGKRRPQFVVDETRRDSYKQYCSSRATSGLSNAIGVKRLVQVGLQEPLAYARSLARFAATLGPVAWEIASKKIEATLPAGIQYGPGWVDDNSTPSHISSFSNEKQKSSNSQILTPSTSDLSSGVGLVEAVRKWNTQNELARQVDASSWKAQFPSQQKPLVSSSDYPVMNNKLLQDNNVSASSQREGEIWNFGKLQQRHSVLGPPDLNVRVPVGSPNPSSNLQICSPHQQPDLALQL